MQSTPIQNINIDKILFKLFSKNIQKQGLLKVIIWPLVKKLDFWEGWSFGCVTQTPANVLCSVTLGRETR